MIFNLDEIRSVLFFCNECRTTVKFPRIRWANLPERCPNCGVAWLRKPTTDLEIVEDHVVMAFKAVKAFRDALQALISVSRTAGFRIGVETTEPEEIEEARARHAGQSSS